ncbi:nucleoside hydrolase [Gracilibacillus salinarum]|uniref:Nucleoside hydrolase n=1 Tax=Gracilibacillus salinarum TaxID=2932255 RepID=A0ABY4GKM6_9BACI|nr:nucleoside hydrolase [Gracilibacillus salinarum]UOQ84764.1 nucleoside hydrolase [Gracilibacillus salinarum]
MNHFYTVPSSKQVRVIINTDAKCEVDDQYAVVHALLTPRLQIKGLIGTHYGKRSSIGAEESTAEIHQVLKLMGMTNRYRVVTGANHQLKNKQTPIRTEGGRLIIEEAMKDDPLPLYVLCQGPLTDVASAYLQEPKIADRLVVIWIGGGKYPHGGLEFNLSNDMKAAQIVFSSSLRLWQVPKNVYDMVRVGIAELAIKVRPRGEIGRYLYEELIAHNARNGHRNHWPKGEMWVLGDSPAVSLLIDDQEFDYKVIQAPAIDDNMNYIFKKNNRNIRVYERVDARFLLEDFFAKLALFAD